MIGDIAIGIGCRLGAPVEAIEALIRQALERAPTGRWLGVFTIEEKATEPGLIAAAERFGLTLVPLGRAALVAQMQHVQTRSVRVAALFGVASVAEAAALAGAGDWAELVVPRIAGCGVTCAVARSGVTA